MLKRDADILDNVDLLTDGFVTRRSELLRVASAGVQRIVAAQSQAGYPTYYSGTGDQADRLFMHLPDGRRCEYRVHADGVREIVRDVQP